MQNVTSAVPVVPYYLAIANAPISSTPVALIDTFTRVQNCTETADQIEAQQRGVAEDCRIAMNIDTRGIGITIMGKLLTARIETVLREPNLLTACYQILAPMSVEGRPELHSLSQLIGEETINIDLDTFRRLTVLAYWSEFVKPAVRNRYQDKNAIKLVQTTSQLLNEALEGPLSGKAKKLALLAPLREALSQSKTWLDRRASKLQAPDPGNWLQRQLKGVKSLFQKS